MRHTTTTSNHIHRSASGPFHIARLALLLGVLATGALVEAILVQPNNYMLDDSQLAQQQYEPAAGSFSPFYADQASSSEQTADKDIVSIIGDGLARLRLARMLDQQQQDEASGQLSQEMAELIQEQQQQQQQQQQAAKSEGEQSLSSSVASMLMNVAQAAAGPSDEQPGEQQQRAHESAGQIVELETNQANQNSGSPSKSELKAAGTSQWYNPKEVIPVLKISSMATPSKYKKVYFRSEKKLVDGAFHSTGSNEEQKKPAALANVAKPLSSAVQRRSSRGSSGGAPPGVLQDGVIDFLKKFRDVYVQTRPGSGAGGSASSSLAANLVSVASSPLAAFLAPASSGSRPNLASAISTASQMVSSASAVSQAAASAASAAQAPASSTSGASGAATAAAAAPGKSPLSTQTYVNFWSKTFPTWVRKMLKQMRRRSLQNSSKRQQQQQLQQQHAHGISQKAAGSSAVSSVVSESAGSQSSAGSS